MITDLGVRLGRQAWASGMGVRLGRQAWASGLGVRHGRQAWASGMGVRLEDLTRAVLESRKSNIFKCNKHQVCWLLTRAVLEFCGSKILVSNKQHRLFLLRWLRFETVLADFTHNFFWLFHLKKI
jgi:hypothetical protein